MYELWHEIHALDTLGIVLGHIDELRQSDSVMPSQKHDGFGPSAQTNQYGKIEPSKKDG